MTRKYKPVAIPNTRQIELFFHCSACRDELPPGESMSSWAQIEAGFTALGIQVWCKRHDYNICHVDFEGFRHPANTTRKP